MKKNRKIFITAKTYPTLSSKYDELVCTAGILDDGAWARIYPLPFRKLDYENRYKKYQWLELPLEKNTADPRPESYRITDISKLNFIGTPVSTDNAWEERRRIVFEGNPVFTDMKELISRAKNNELSLALFKPEKILDFTIEESAREWSKDKLKMLNEKARQLHLYQSEEEVKKEFSVVKKMPYKFSYRFVDCNGEERKLMIVDWEIGALYWNCLKRADNNEQHAIEKVRKKYLDEFAKKDVYLFLGTTRQFHGWAKNPFVIIGVFYPPFKSRQKLF